MTAVYTPSTPFLSLGGYKIEQDRTQGRVVHDAPRNHDFGSLTPIVEDDPDWSGFSLPEGLRITPR